MSDKFRNNFIRRFGFLAVLLALLIFASGALYNYAMTDERTEFLNRNTTEIDLNKEAEDTIDAVILGDSLSYQILSPMQIYEDTGITSYVAGQSLQDMVEMLHMYREVTTRQEPKVLLIETHALVHSDGAAYTAESLAVSALSTAFPVFRLHNLWKEAVVPMDPDAAVRLTYKGFHINGDVVPAGDLSYYMYPDDSAASLPSDNRLLFRWIVEDCRKRGIRVVLFAAPSPANYDYSIHNAMQALADSYGLDFIDLNERWEEIGIDWETDSVDGGDHLNIRGAKKATAYFEPILKGYGLTDHRDDPKYENWNELVPEYDAAAAAAEK